MMLAELTIPIGGLRRGTAPICRQCLRSFATTSARQAGHNKWSKTKHIKAVTDKKKMMERTSMGSLIAMWSKRGGADVRFNPQLANAIAAAMKASVPKSVIESAIARGQGRLPNGIALEPMTLEFLMPPNIAIIVEVETDNKIRSLNDLKLVAKKAGAVAGSTSFYFTRRGRAEFHGQDGGPCLADILEEAIEHKGIEDVEELPDGDFVAWTHPTALMAITDALTANLELEVVSADIVWDPNDETKAGVDAQAFESLESMLSKMREHMEVKAIYANVQRGEWADEDWDKLESHIDM